MPPVVLRALHVRRALSVLIAVAVPWFSNAGLAQTAQALSLAEALRLAENRSLMLVAQDAATAAARDMSLSAGQRPDPVLKAGINNLPINGSDAFSLTRDFMTMRLGGRDAGADARRQAQGSFRTLRARGQTPLRPIAHLRWPTCSAIRRWPGWTGTTRSAC